MKGGDDVRRGVESSDRAARKIEQILVLGRTDRWNKPFVQNTTLGILQFEEEEVAINIGKKIEYRKPDFFYILHIDIAEES